MVKTTVYLDDETVAALKGISRRSAKPQAQLIRDALRVFTRGGNPPLPAGMGMFDSGHRDTTQNGKGSWRQAPRQRRCRSYPIPGLLTASTPVATRTTGLSGPR